MITMTGTSDVSIREHVAKLVGKSKERVEARISFEFPDHGECVHPTMFIEVRIGDGWNVLAEVDLVKVDIQCALDICKRLEEGR